MTSVLPSHRSPVTPRASWSNTSLAAEISPETQRYLKPTMFFLFLNHDEFYHCRPTVQCKLQDKVQLETHASPTTARDHSPQSPSNSSSVQKASRSKVSDVFRNCQNVGLGSTDPVFCISKHQSQKSAMAMSTK